MDEHTQKWQLIILMRNTVTAQSETDSLKSPPPPQGGGGGESNVTVTHALIDYIKSGIMLNVIVDDVINHNSKESDEHPFIKKL